MQRISHTALAVALALFITSVSLALLAAAWFIAMLLTNGSVQPLLPK